MEIDFISDIHNDFWIKEYNPSEKMNKLLKRHMEMMNMLGGDALIVCGDLGHYFAQDSQFLKMCKEIYKYVMIVPGNHDRYLVSGAQQKKYMYNSMNRILEMKRFCAENDIIYLDGDVVVLDGYRFAGAGMSWDNSFLCNIRDKLVSAYETRELFNNTMNDARLIFEGSDNYYIQTAYGGKFLKSSFNPFELLQKEKEKLLKIKEHDNIDIMITHYPPTNPYKYQLSDYEFEESSTFYMFDGEEDIERISPKYWLFGHMHDQYCFYHKGVNFLCNPLGYPGENTYATVKTILL